MSEGRVRKSVVFVALAVFAATSLQAAMVRDMDLGEVCNNADKVFRGVVVSATEGTVTVGGGELPTVVYVVHVTEGFKGEFLTKGDDSYVEIEMLGRIKSAPVGDLQHFSVLPELPELAVGGEYVLMTTAPSAAGLSVPVGLGQGVYTLTGQGKTEMAKNAAGSSLSYDDLANQIQAAVSQ